MLTLPRQKHVYHADIEKPDNLLEACFTARTLDFQEHSANNSLQVMFVANCDNGQQTSANFGNS